MLGWPLDIPKPQLSLEARPTEAVCPSGPGNTPFQKGRSPSYSACHSPNVRRFGGTPRPAPPMQIQSLMSAKPPGPAAKPAGDEGAAAAGALGNPLVRAGLVLGVGFGGLADGIVLHSILGWHHLICAGATVYCQPTSVGQLQLENAEDGYFDLALWLVLLAGTAMIFSAARRDGRPWSGRILLGSMLLGSGLFNFVEGLVDHQILGIHHVLPGTPHQFLFDMLFLANGVLFAAVGALLIRGRRGGIG